MGAVVDVEFDDMEGVPDILNALHVNVRLPSPRCLPLWPFLVFFSPSSAARGALLAAGPLTTPFSLEPLGFPCSWQVKFERYDESSDKIRTASLLPKQIRECEERISWLKSQEASFASTKEARKIREAVLAVCKEHSVLGAEQNAKLEAEYVPLV